MFEKLSNYITSNYVSRYWILAVDVFASTVSSVIVYWGISFFTESESSPIAYLAIAVISVLVSLVAFLLFKTHHGIIRHTTMKEMWRVAYASLLKGVLLFWMLFILSNRLLAYNTPNIFVAEVIDIIVTMFFLILIRIFLTNLYSLLVGRGNNLGQKKIFIYGQGDDAVSVLGMIEKSKDANYKCEGFLTSRGETSRKMLCGYPIYEVETERAFQKLAVTHSISAVIFPNHKTARGEKERLVEYCLTNKIEVLIKPNLNTLAEGDNIIAPIREIKIEDLLGRDEVSINMAEINNFLTDKVVLVTGAAGSIGSQLCRLLLTIPIQKLLLLDCAETPLHNIQLELRDKSPAVEKKFVIADVRSRKRLEVVFERYRPNVIFHAAAYKHVPLMESNPCEAVSVNVFGLKKMADLAVKYGAEKFVMISTDKAVNPANVMGASKRIAEIYVQSLGKAIAAGVVKGSTKFITTRFGNVLGSNGSVIPLFRDQIAKGGPITVTDPNIIRYFMTIPEACRLVLEAATMGKGDEIFVFDMGDAVKIVDLAKNMIKLAGLEEGADIEIKIVGLRPGEKLYEELLNDEENTLPTTHRKIFLAKARANVYAKVEKHLEVLKRNELIMDKEGTVATMKQIVPEFKSYNSRYGKLDNV